ncbi:MAG: helix-turn-helix domain-containing protein [Cuniculiplasma divulgatum]|nr:MAG: helix-turn-helix domain-containing protein [Cuniculiplasma divulgatum]
MKISAGNDSRYILVQFKIRHEGCWSNSLAETGSIAHTIIIKPFKDRNYVFGGIEVQSEFLKGFRLFYNGFRHSGSIREVMQLDAVDSRRKLYRIIFREKYEDMVSTVMYEHSSLFQSDFIDGTGEEIVAILPQDDVHDARRELENLGELSYFKVRDVNIDDFVGTNLDLTPQERHALHWAHSSGYYEVPRQVHLEDVAAKVGLSKSALAEALRKAESKVITKWESEHMFLHGLFSK